MLAMILALVFAVNVPPRPEPKPPPEKPAPAKEAPRQLFLPDDADVRLDGRPVKIGDAPKGATVELIELDPDGVTIRRLYLRSPK
jgi:hypothetical protein